jgi:hypothetical protein
MSVLLQHFVTDYYKKSVNSFANDNAILQSEMSQKKNFMHIAARSSNLSHTNAETYSFYGNNLSPLVSDSSDLRKYVILMAGFGHV